MGEERVVGLSNHIEEVGERFQSFYFPFLLFPPPPFFVFFVFLFFCFIKRPLYVYPYVSHYY